MTPSDAIKALLGDDRDTTMAAWLGAVAERVVKARPDLVSLVDVVGAKPGLDVLDGLTIGEMAVVYEALLALTDHSGRRNAGQFFTPDDSAEFMALRTPAYTDGVWLDPCCGVGNLTWHLLRFHRSAVRDVVLMDRDPIALRSAVALIAETYATSDDDLLVLHSNSTCRDFLDPAPLPDFDHAIVNPPYSVAESPDGYATASTKDTFAYFLERLAGSAKTIVAVTPASWLGAAKYEPLRDVLMESFEGGDVYSFDNMPDTFFRGFKYGSTNTSQKNMVRAAVLVAGHRDGWRTTPIIRWTADDRRSAFVFAPSLLSPLRIGPHGQWVRVPSDLARAWDRLAAEPTVLADLVSDKPTAWSLDVATTPRYYISASYRPLSRANKVVLYFPDERSRDHAALVLNSSVPYLWWRGLDGGVTLTKAVLLSTPMPEFDNPALVQHLKDTEEASLVTKMNAGKPNENIKRPEWLVNKLNGFVLPGNLDLLYTNNVGGWMRRLQARADSLAETMANLKGDLVVIREDSGLTMEDVAERMGYTVEAIEEFERYDADPTLSTIRRYALAVGATITIEVSPA